MSKIKIAIGVLSAASAATWAPYLLDEPRPPRPDDDLEEIDEGTPRPGYGFESALADAPEPTATATATATATDDGQESPTSRELLTSSRNLLEELRNLVPGERQGHLDQLSTSWGTRGEAPTQPASEERLYPLVDAPVDDGRAEVEAFLEAHPLSAILYRDGEPLALLGSFVVRPGQELIPGLSLTAIETRAVALEHDGRPIRLALPPVRSRPTVSDDDEDEPQEADPEPPAAALPVATEADTNDR